MIRRFRIVLAVGLMIVASVLVFTWKQEEVFAALTSLTIEPFESWGWIGTPTDQTASTTGSATDSSLGFLHMNCASDSSCNPATGNYPNVQVDVDTGDVNGYAWLGNASSTSGQAYSTGWLNFDPAPLPDASPFGDSSCPSGSKYPAPPCNSAQIDTSNQSEISGWARFESLSEAAPFTTGTPGDNDLGWVLLRGTNSADGQEYGVLYVDGTLEGWAFSGGGSLDLAQTTFDESVGFGWISFSAAAGGSPTGPTGGYLSTERGDVYVQDGIENPTGALSPAQFNATFLLLANGTIQNFVSEELGAGTFTDDTFGTIELPDATNNFTTELGSIDLTTLTTDVGGGENAFGDSVNTMTDFSSFTGNQFLDGSVYHVDGGSSPYTITDSITFTNGVALPTTGNNFDGRGTIVVEGDLTINANIFYNNSSLLHVDNLASIAWIVRGDLVIGPNVSHVVGAFFVLGDDSIGDGISDGQIQTLPASASQLAIYGMTMARSYDLQRSYEGQFGLDEPSELIYYDGRVLVNTPPGLQDLASTLPSFSAN